MISVIVLTKNEEKDLENCLRSVSWSDDVHVLDSGSTDGTLEVARNSNARISTHVFESFGLQRNYALENLPLKYKWILFLDADEMVTEKFRLALSKAIEQSNDTIAGFYCCWKMILEGRWLRFSDNFPKWQFRLLHIERARFVDFGHGQKEGILQGQIGYVREPYLHFGFSKGWNHWIERHNRYSDQEALARYQMLPPVKNIFSRHGSVRNPALKSWLSKMPGWPFLRFVYAYVLKLGFLEGSQGFIYCANMAYYEFLIQIKIRELKKNKN